MMFFMGLELVPSEDATAGGSCCVKASASATRPLPQRPISSLLDSFLNCARRLIDHEKEESPGRREEGGGRRDRQAGESKEMAAAQHVPMCQPSASSVPQM